ncbi:neuraminidase-like domain-containing protein (plasmid) [Streptomyces sp. DSM 116496]|uniref:neuraminidase-like domain-containing protein n=1 Tax=Streptomyces stoeckheimensis TaxID=3344656 RepID=UPI0038B2C950
MSDPMQEKLELLVQAPLSPDSVRDAVTSYLTDFGEVANLTTVATYRPAADPESGKDYLLGYSTARSELSWFWRSHDNAHGIGSAGLSEWMKIEASLPDPGAGRGDVVRPVAFGGRLFVVWVDFPDRTTADTADGSVPGNALIRVSYLSFDGTLGVPATTEVPLPSQNTSGPYQLIAVETSSKESIAVCLTDRDPEAPDSARTLDHLFHFGQDFSVVNVEQEATESFTVVALKRFYGATDRPDADRNVVQYPLA